VKVVGHLLKICCPGAETSNQEMTMTHDISLFSILVLGWIVTMLVVVFFVLLSKYRELEQSMRASEITQRETTKRLQE